MILCLGGTPVFTTQHSEDEMILDTGIATCQPFHKRANFSKTEISLILCPDPPSYLCEINSLGANS